MSSSRKTVLLFFKVFVTGQDKALPGEATENGLPFDSDDRESNYAVLQDSVLGK